MTQRSILLVEDNRDDAEFALLALRSVVELPIDVAGDGHEALEFLFEPTQRHRPALVLLDLRLPKTNGFEVLERIRATPQTRHLVVVVLTSSDSPEDVQRAYELGANSFVQKPVEYAEYRSTMELVARYWANINEYP